MSHFLAVLYDPDPFPPGRHELPVAFSSFPDDELNRTLRFSQPFTIDGTLDSLWTDANNASSCTSTSTTSAPFTSSLHIDFDTYRPATSAGIHAYRTTDSASTYTPHHSYVHPGTSHLTARHQFHVELTSYVGPHNLTHLFGHQHFPPRQFHPLFPPWSNFSQYQFTPSPLPPTLLPRQQPPQPLLLPHRHRLLPHHHSPTHTHVSGRRLCPHRACCHSQPSPNQQPQPLAHHLSISLFQLHIPLHRRSPLRHNPKAPFRQRPTTTAKNPAIQPPASGAPQWPVTKPQPPQHQDSFPLPASSATSIHSQPPAR